MKTLVGLVEIAAELGIATGHLHGLLKRGFVSIPRFPYGVRSYYLEGAEITRVRDELKKYRRGLRLQRRVKK
jgi:hypothetical protein